MNLPGGQLAVPAAVVDQELEQVLLGLADGSYVLSTPDGAIAECGVGVVGLLAAPADALVGRPTVDVLVAGADAAARNEFELLLRAPSFDPAAPRTFRAQTASGAVRPLRFLVVAVPLALGWEFTSLLSELRARDAGTWHPEELRLRHGHALEAVEGVVRSGRQPDPNARLAGILIVVRDVDAPPLTREDVDRRMAEQREAAREAAAEAARLADEAAGRAPGSDLESEDAAPGLEDIVERARILRERVEEAERDAAAAEEEREQALATLAVAEAERAEAMSARALAESAAEAARSEALSAVRTAESTAEVARVQGLAALRAAESDAEAARAEAAGAAAEAERLRAELQTVRDTVHDERAAHSESAEAEIAALHAANEMAHGEAEALRAELHAVHDELQDARGECALARGEVAAVRAALGSANDELAGARRELDATRTELAARVDELQRYNGDVAAAGDELASVRSELATRNAELVQARTEIDRIRSEHGAAIASLDEVRAEREQARIHAQQLLGEAEHARAAADAIRAEFAFDPGELRANPQQGSPAERTPWSAPSRAAVAPVEAAAPKLPLPAVGSGQAAALIALDGSFKRLDEAFCHLLGCREEDLHAARWPSIIDRENLKAHQEIARALKAGEIQSAEVETVYMHAHGLLVPIAGTVSMHRAEPAGPPTHFLFRADVSRTAGTPGVS